MRFLVIGGQKCATTTLFQHLSAHPQIWMPGEKELNFFAKPDRYARGIDWYRSHFGDAPPDALCGEASPLYLAHGSAPERIRRHLPEVRLVALLRNPIDRAFSHYRMAVRRGLESEAFGHAVRLQLSRGEPPLDPRDPERDYLHFGAYGRCFAHYLRHFPRRQIHVEFTEDLAREPAQVLRRVTAFIGADPGFAYPGLGRVFHAGGEARIPRGWLRVARRGLKLARPLIGAQRERAAAFWLETEASVRREASAGPSPAERALLADHYAKDVALLERLLGLRVPWSEFR